MEFPYERAAMYGCEMPDGLDWVDQWMFLSLRLLYESNKKGVISREVGRVEKGKLAHQRSILEQKFKVRERLVANCAERTIRIESAANAYAKDRTLENADKLYKALYGMEPSKKERKEECETI